MQEQKKKEKEVRFPYQALGKKLKETCLFLCEQHFLPPCSPNLTQKTENIHTHTYTHTLVVFLPSAHSNLLRLVKMLIAR